jgi:hypothetical protein
MLIHRGGIRMATEKIVKCFVQKKDDPDGSKTSRFVPLDIFELWKFLMEVKHNFHVSGGVTSLWFERNAASESSYAGIEYEPVTQVEIFYFCDSDGMLHQQIRYFPAADEQAYEKVRAAFLSHYEEGREGPGNPPKLNEIQGVWIKR